MAEPYLNRVNATIITPELLMEVVQMHADMEPEDRQVPEVRMIRLFELLKSRGWKGDRHADVALAVDFRLRALAHLMGSRETLGWTLPAEDGAELVHPNVLRSAASQPVVLSADGSVAFEPEAFRRSCFAG